MKNNLLKIYLLTFFLVSDFVVFAQAGTDTSEGDLEEVDDPPMSISPKLIYLAILGIAFAFYYFSKNRKQQLN